MELSPGWIQAGITTAGLLVTIGGVWALNRHQVQEVMRRQEKMEGRQQDQDEQIAGFQKLLTEMASTLERTIRSEFDKAREATEKRLFAREGGRPYYRYVIDCEQERKACREGLLVEIGKVATNVGRLDERTQSLGREVDGIRAKME